MKDQLASHLLMQSVYNCCHARRNLSENAKGIYLRWARNLPSMIQISGLAQAIMWQCEKAADREPDRIYLLADLATVLGIANQGDDGTRARALQRRVVEEADLMNYMRLTRRTQQALEYFKRFAVSVTEATMHQEAD